ncbi:MAG: hypothetical protein NT141_01675 [candidate division WWE3 bacterium]|nr:hypothetical protein [candidate division WWE3 bacterium]
MKMDKKSKKADQIGNLYRAALYLAKDDVDQAIRFISSNPYLPNPPYHPYQIEELKAEPKTRLKFAEKLLDLYKLQLRLP